MTAPKLIPSSAALGRVIRDARRALGISQAELGSRTGLTQVGLSRLERSTGRAQIDTLLRVLAVLRLELAVQQVPERLPPAPWET
jgi:HTH-type transcriptional regulator/antitoxin HipB